VKAPICKVQVNFSAINPVQYHKRDSLCQIGCFNDKIRQDREKLLHRDIGMRMLLGKRAEQRIRRGKYLFYSCNSTFMSRRSLLSSWLMRSSMPVVRES